MYCAKSGFWTRKHRNYNRKWEGGKLSKGQLKSNEDLRAELFALQRSWDRSMDLRLGGEALLEAQRRLAIEAEQAREWALDYAGDGAIFLPGTFF